MWLKEAGLQNDFMSYPGGRVDRDGQRDAPLPIPNPPHPGLEQFYLKFFKEAGDRLPELQAPGEVQSGPMEREEGYSFELRAQGIKTMGWSLEELDVVCGKESKVAAALAPPPAFIHHLNVSDDVIWIKGKLITSLSLVIIQGYSRDPCTTSPG